MPDTNKKLKKELKLLDVYAIATGTTLSGGFFLLPAIASAQAGPAVLISYFLTAIPLIPAMLCLMELATAMPRAGGTYYFLDRSMGPMMGTIGGIGSWFSLVLKNSFALIAMGAYLNLFLNGNLIIPLAIGFALFFGFINLMGAKESGNLQAYLVYGILILLSGFIIHGLSEVKIDHFSGMFDVGAHSIFATTGLVYISFVGVTKVASVAEEVENPERNLPLGMFLSFMTAVVFYGLGIFVMVGVLPMEQLSTSLTPVAAVAEHMVGHWGSVLVSIAAVCAFSSAANAGILSASRYPMAMSRDHLIPRIFRRLSKRQIPIYSVLITVGIMLVFIVFLNPLKIAKLASAFQLAMFALCCLAVIIMRESHIEAYDPGFHSPFYPWTPIIGIVAQCWLILEMGTMPVLFSIALVVVAVAWYYYYGRQRVSREGAILHVFERLGKGRHQGLEVELRGILKEKGLRDHDPFSELITQAHLIDLDKKIRFDKLITRAAEVLSEKVSAPSQKIEQEILESTKAGGTPVSQGAALPHMRLHHILEPELLIVRAKKGIDLEVGEGFWGEHKAVGPVYAVFFLLSPEENPKQHLRILAKLAGRIDDDDFMVEWLRAQNEQELKETLLLDERFLSLELRAGTPIGALIGRELKNIQMPEESLVAIIHRDGKTLVPRGHTVLQEGDAITIIGDKKGIREFREQYVRR